MMKEKKDMQIKFRLSAALKAQIEDYCAANDLNVSEFLRLACLEVISKQERAANE